jgi:hypothetical protein
MSGIIGKNASRSSGVIGTADTGIASLAADSSPQLGGFLDAAGNYIQMEKGGDISSASPTVIDTDGDYFDVTGTTNFAAFTVAADRHFFIQFDGALTMTHDATDLDLPGGANITTAAGDVAEFFSTGANTVQCVNYTKADGTAVVATTELSGDSSPQLGGFLDANGNYIQMQKGGDIASASPTVIDTDGDFFAVTGTTNFAAFTVAADRHFFLEFGGALTMTHGAGTLDLPGAANITTAASDVGEFVSTAADTVTCVNYTKRDGTAVVAAGGWTQGTEVVTTSGTEHDFTSIPAGVKVIQMGFENVTLNGTSSLIVQLGDDGGFESSGYNSASSRVYSNAAVMLNDGGLGYVIIIGSAARVFSGVLTLVNKDATAHDWGSMHAGKYDSSNSVHGGGWSDLSAELNSIRVTTINGSDVFDGGAININYL